MVQQEHLVKLSYQMAAQYSGQTILDLLVVLAHKVQLDLLVRPVHRALKERLALLVVLAHKVHRAQRDHKELPDLLVQSVQPARKVQ
jgi:hypothetical protein